jgi:hypothetical protein
MKKILFLLAFISFQFLALAKDDKDKKTPEQKAHTKTSELVTALNLTKDQESKLYASHLKYYQTTDAYEAKDPSKKDKKKFKDQAQAIREAEYKRILTPAQYKQYLNYEKAEDLKKEKEKKAKKEDLKKLEDKLKKK